MGADGGIYIYDWDKIVEHFGQDKAKLLHNLPNSYLGELNGKTYFRCYTDYGQHMFTFFDDPNDWFCKPEEKPVLQEVFDWMEANAKVTYWECWT